MDDEQQDGCACLALLAPECGEHATGHLGCEFVRELLKGVGDALCATLVRGLCAVELGEHEGGYLV